MLGRSSGATVGSGLIQSLSLWVMRESLEQCRLWRQLGFEFGVGVNLSARSLQLPGLPHRLVEYLTETSVPPAALTIEITESVIMAEPERALAVIRRLKDMGVRISIDDFGTGYSSLSYLRDMHPDEIKIDTSFVIDVGKAGEQAVIVRAVTDLGHNLGLEVVAEGVEGQRILDVLLALPCDWAQGFHLGHPQPADQLTACLYAQTHIRRSAQ